ncbi:MAG: peptidylprolyl isomerase [Rhodobacter sp.]|nr:peptidylprolyl isomerase [Rhodobacter sp.]
MQAIRGLFLGAALGLGLIPQVQAQEVTADTVVATVGGEDITIGHLIAMLRSLPAEQQQMPNDVLFDGLIERLIQQMAISRSVTELSKGTELRLENERHALIASAAVDRMAAGVEVTDEEVQAAYDRRFADFSPAREYQASHILVETEEEAAALVAELEGGADFAELAKLKSTGPSGPNGGRLGWFGPGAMVPPFEAAVVELQPGQVSAPVQTQFGWHVITLHDTRLPEVPTIDQMRQELANEVFVDILRAGISEIIEAAGVERKDVSGIDPAILRDPSLLDF